MNIGVFFGSRSPEHDVSIITGTMICKGLKQMGYNVSPVYISKDGEWFVGEELGSIEFYKSSDKNEKLKQFAGYTLDFSKSKGKMVLVKKQLFSNKEIEINLAFPAFHGQNGEDGTIQGLFEMINLAYVGCDVKSSAVTMDKVTTKLIYQKFNLPTTKFVYFKNNEWLTNSKEIKDNIRKTLTWPVFVKPSRLGSSIGMAKVKTDEELEFAVEVALHYDSIVLVEESVEDLMDLTIAIIGNDDNLQASLIQESAFSQDFFTYEDKYLNNRGAQLGNAQKSIVIPAEIEEKISKEITDLAIETYKIFDCSGISRVDFLYDKTFKKYYLSEINTLPGTLYQHLWKKSGIDLSELLKKLIDLALDKYDKKNRLTTTFESEILTKSGSKSNLAQ